MLDELKNLNYHGGKDGLLFFLCDVIGNSQIKVHDAEVICAHASGKRYLSVRDLIEHCLAFGWIHLEEDAISVVPSIGEMLHDKDVLNTKLVTSSVNLLFSEGVFDSTMFSYDSLQCSFSFKNELFPLSLSSVRNVLISQHFLLPLRDAQGSRFYISSDYEILIAKHCKAKRKLMSLEKLKEQLENNERAGEIAELFVVEYEKRRLGIADGTKVKRISDIDVSAGYDIVSVNTPEAVVSNRFIEVKAISTTAFFWSKNEYAVAKLLGTNYYLYLVDLTKISDNGYSPEIVNNPAQEIMENCQWLIEPQSYHIQKVDC